MSRNRIRKILTLAVLALSIGELARSQPPDAPNAQRTREELSRLLESYPPALKRVLALDPSLLSNKAYLAPYPGLLSFLGAHPEIASSPSFYAGENTDRADFREQRDPPSVQLWRQVLNGLSVFAGFGMAIGLIVWLIRTILDYRRWHRLAKVQTDVHTKLIDRFTANDELMAYIQSHAGKRFLESAPIDLDAGPRSMGAPLGRIMWSVQAGLVLVAGGVGMDVVSVRVSDEAAQPIHALGVLGVALGLGFVVSAAVSFLISHKLGLIERVQPRHEPGSLV